MCAWALFFDLYSEWAPCCPIESSRPAPVSSCLKLPVCLCWWFLNPLLLYSSIRLRRALKGVGSALPGRHLNFLPRYVVHSRSLHGSVYLHPLLRWLPCYSSTSPVFPVPPPQQHPAYSPLATHLCAPNQSKELSRLALEKLP